MEHDFDRYCDEHNIQPGEEPAAFAAWMHEQTGWDGQMTQYEEEHEGSCAEGLMYAALFSIAFYFFVWQAIIRPLFNN